MRGRFLSRLLLVTWVAAWPEPSQLLAAPDTVTRPDEQLFIAALTVDTFTVTEMLLSYWDGTRLYIPLLEFCEWLQLPIEGSVEEGHVSGWIRDESNTFLLDLNRRRLNVGGLDRDVDWSRVERHETDIYVPLQLLAEWLELEARIQFNSSRIHLPPGQELPLEQRLERRGRWERFSNSNTAIVGDDEPLMRPGPRLLDWPVMEATLSGGVLRTSRQTGGFAESSVLASAHVAGATGTLSANLSTSPGTDPSADVRLSLGHTPFQPGSFAWEIGDIDAPELTLLTRRETGVGLVAGNLSNTAGSNLFRRDFTGDALQGWDVELYRNDELLAFTTVDESNRFNFRDVPVSPGLNVFRFVLYGPQGQRREWFERMFIDARIHAASRSRWRAFVVDPESRLIPGAGNTGDENKRPELAELSYGVRYQRALGDQWLAGVTAFSANLETEGRASYISPTLAGGVGTVLYEGQWIQSNRGGWASRLGVRVNRARTTASVELENFSDFESPEFELSGSEGRLATRLRANVQSRALPRVPLTLDIEHREFDQRPTLATTAQSKASLRGGFTINGITLSKSVQVESRVNGDLRYSGGALFSITRDKFALSGQMGYQLDGTLRARNINLFGTRRLGESTVARFSGSHTFGATPTTQANLSLLWTGKRFTVGVNAGWSSNGLARAGLVLSSSLQRSGRDWRLSSQARTSMFSAIATVFLDQNGNGAFDAGEQPLQGIRILGGQETDATDANGQLVVTGLDSSTPARLRLIATTIENPFWRPAVNARRVLARPGQTVEVLFPVMVSNEIDGTVYLRRNGEREPLASVELQILDSDGRVIRTTRTAYDGFYLVDEVPGGTWRVRISPEQLRTMGASAIAPREVEFTSAEGDFTTLDWTLDCGSC